MKNNQEIHLANFMDSCLEALDKKGNLGTAPSLYNPRRFASKVVHFTPCENDFIYSNIFDKWNIEIFPYLERRSHFIIIDLVRSLYKVYKKFKEADINIVRGRLPYLGSFMGCLAGRCLGVPIIISLGGNNRISQQRDNRYNYGSKLISYAMEKIVLYLSHIIIAPNHYTKEYVASIIGKKMANKKVRIIPWRITHTEPDHVDEMKHLDSLGLKAEVPYIIVVGHLNKYKYSDIMIKVAEEVMTSVSSEIQLVFCGEGPLLDQGKSSLQAFPNVLFIGWQPHEIVQSLIKHASLVLVPMSGFVLLEAASFGRPVITSNIEWHKELISDGVNGFLVNPLDIKAWVDKIKLITADSSLAKRLGDKLREVFNCRYDQESLINDEIALYRSLL